jgi:hypothetical protein
MRSTTTLVLMLALAATALAGDEGDSIVLRVHPVSDLVEHGDAAGLAARAAKILGEDGSVEVTRDGGSLVVRAAPLDQEAISRWLRRLREQHERLVLVETRILRSRGPLLGDGEERIVRFLDSAAETRLLEAIEKREDTSMVSAPSLMCRDRRSAKVSVLKQISYVGDFEVVTGRDGKTVADPVVMTVAEGLEVDVRPILSRDGEVVTLLLTMTQTAVDRPIPRRRILVEGGAQVELQTPEVTSVTWRRAVTLGPDRSALLDLGATPDRGEERVLVLLRARRVTDLASTKPLKGDDLNLPEEERK